MRIGLSNRKDAAPRARASGRVKAVHVNVHTAVRPASLDESANNQTKAMGPECSLTWELVGSVFNNPHLGGILSSQSVCVEISEAVNV
jgi:hypothetical protein